MSLVKRGISYGPRHVSIKDYLQAYGHVTGYRLVNPFCDLTLPDNSKSFYTWQHVTRLFI